MSHLLELNVPVFSFLSSLKIFFSSFEEIDLCIHILVLHKGSDSAITVCIVSQENYALE